jgi:hypothetical protein
MRTTVDIPDPIYRQLKSRAVSQRRSVKELILRGVESELRNRSKKRGRRVAVPLVPSKRPSSVLLDNAKVFEIIPFP